MITMYDAIVLAGGKGQRSNLSYNKVLHFIGEQTILERAASVFLDDSRCNQVVIVAANEDFERIKKLFRVPKVTIVKGGQTRSESVKNGLEEIQAPYVLIHDGARPFVPHRNIDDLLEGLASYKALTLAVPVFDTVKRVKNKYIIDDVLRDGLYRIQTPQAFHTSTITKAHAVEINNEALTCDASLVRQMLGIETKIVLGDQRNIKFTTSSDLKLLELIVDAKNRI